MPLRKSTADRMRRQAGFTLIEIMVVIVILGLLAALVVPKLVGRTEEAKRTQTRVQIKNIQQAARVHRNVVRPRWPMIVLVSPKGWTGPKVVDGLEVEGTFRSHQVPLSDPAAHPEHLTQLETWLRSYRPEELFDDDRPTPDRQRKQRQHDAFDDDIRTQEQRPRREIVPRADDAGGRGDCTTFHTQTSFNWLIGSASALRTQAGIRTGRPS